MRPAGGAFRSMKAERPGAELCRPVDTDGLTPLLIVLNDALPNCADRPRDALGLALESVLVLAPTASNSPAEQVCRSPGTALPGRNCNRWNCAKLCGQRRGAAKSISPPRRRLKPIYRSGPNRLNSRSARKILL
jgi:hypothetical protein